MEGRLVITALAFTILACSKNDIQPHKEIYLSKQTLSKQTTSDPAIYSSDWETVPAWHVEATSQGIIFSYSYQLSQLKNEGDLNKNTVLVFARNLWTAERNLKEPAEKDKPMAMPFYFLPYFEKPNCTELWNYSVEDKRVNVVLTVKGTDNRAAPDKKIQLRFMVIPQQLLDQKKQTAQTLRKLSYDQLIQTFRVDL